MSYNQIVQSVHHANNADFIGLSTIPYVPFVGFEKNDYVSLGIARGNMRSLFLCNLMLIVM
jgi:hypothetical protein